MRNLKKWLPAIVMMLVIYAISSVSGATINAVGLGKESIQINGHFLLFFILCFTFYKATKNILLSIILTSLYGVLDEFHQLYTPARSSSTFDILVDTIGALLSGAILWKLQALLPKKLKNWLKK